MEGHFESYNGKKIVGEKSWGYSCKGVYPQAKERIIATLGKDIKLIYIVRHPYERLESLWMQFITSGLPDYASFSFTEALRLNPIFLDSNRYWTQISFYMEDFNIDNIKIVFFEDFKADPNEFVNDLFKFLEVDPFSLDFTRTVYNRSKGKLAETNITRALRKIPKFKFLRDSLPGEIRLLAKKALKKKVVDRPSYDLSTIKWLEKELTPEVEQILHYCGKPPDFWKLDEYFV